LPPVICRLSRTLAEIRQRRRASLMPAYFMLADMRLSRYALREENASRQPMIIQRMRVRRCAAAVVCQTPCGSHGAKSEEEMAKRAPRSDAAASAPCRAASRDAARLRRPQRERRFQPPLSDESRGSSAASSGAPCAIKRVSPRGARAPGSEARSAACARLSAIRRLERRATAVCLC